MCDIWPLEGLDWGGGGEFILYLWLYSEEQSDVVIPQPMYCMFHFRGVYCRIPYEGFGTCFGFLLTVSV